jgi:hypothetical protein
VRLLRTVTAVAVCGLLLLAGPAPVQASAGVSSSDLLLAVPASRELPRREMNDEVFRNDKGWLILKGNVDPGWNNRNVQIYKRLCKACKWTLVKKTPTDRSGRWRTRIYAPPTGYWYWKGLVPKSGAYGRSVTQVYRTYVV